MALVRHYLEAADSEKAFAIAATIHRDLTRTESALEVASYHLDSHNFTGAAEIIKSVDDAGWRRGRYPSLLAKSLARNVRCRMLLPSPK